MLWIGGYLPHPCSGGPFRSTSSPDNKYGFDRRRPNISGAEGIWKLQLLRGTRSCTFLALSPWYSSFECLFWTWISYLRRIVRLLFKHTPFYNPPDSTPSPPAQCSQTPQTFFKISIINTFELKKELNILFLKLKMTSFLDFFKIWLHFFYIQIFYHDFFYCTKNLKAS